MHSTLPFEDSALDTSKTKRKVPIKDQLAHILSCWASLDLQPTEDFEFTDPLPDRSSGFDRNGDLQMTCIDRCTSAPAPASVILRGAFSRAKSSPIILMCGAPTENEIIPQQKMTSRTQNLHCIRSSYNRSIGYSVLSSSLESGGMQGMHAMRARVQEFEDLLEGL
uniref:Uncharacterized protein n=1 Tax=Cryptomonas curvata TaxID=233186 RepID=A0A7S0M1T7_9CRYP|mmetsp:Transcript_20809/g.43716  ORF Transcript_20809/g.43716 Transcript_20809/m.43716 type:complete len:166 (+) Transcript_20809:68-565(+)